MGADRMGRRWLVQHSCWAHSSNQAPLQAQTTPQVGFVPRASLACVAVPAGKLRGPLTSSRTSGRSGYLSRLPFPHLLGR